MVKHSGIITLTAAICVALVIGGCSNLPSEKERSAAKTAGEAKPPKLDEAALRLEAHNALQHDQPALAVKALQPLIAHEDPDAIFVLGFLHDLGAGADWDGETALRLIKRAAEAKHVAAQRYLVWKYLNGFNVKKDLAESARLSREFSPTAKPATLLPDSWLSFANGTVEPNIRRALLWMQMAATDRDPIAQGNLADVYLKSEILPANLESHVFWFMKAADGGNPRAAFKLSKYYSAGILVPETKDRAMSYLKVAADGGWTEAERALGAAFVSGDRVPLDKALAKGWFEKAAKKGDASAMVELSRLLLEGAPTSRNSKEALHWLEQAATQGNASADEQLGAVYLSGAVVSRNPDRCIQYFETAAKLGSVWAKFQLGRFYLYELGEKPDYDKAQFWLNEAAAAGSAEAMAELAFGYETGRGEAQNEVKAFEWYEKAGRQGNGYSQVRLANLLIAGRGIERDIEEAYEWTQVALKHGETGAHFLQGYFLFNGFVVPRDYLAAAKEYAEGLRSVRNGGMELNFIRAVAMAPSEVRPQLRALLDEILSVDPEAADNGREEAAIQALGSRQQWCYDRERFNQRLQKHVESGHAWAARILVEHELFLENREKRFDALPATLADVGGADDNDRALTAAALKLFRSRGPEDDQAAIAELNRLSKLDVGDAEFLLGIACCARIQNLTPSDAAKHFARARSFGSFCAELLTGGSDARGQKFVDDYSGPPLAKPPADETFAERKAKIAATRSHPPIVLWQQRPTYPLRQRIAGHDGEVTLRFRVDENGHVIEGKIVSASNPDFEGAALDAVRTWLFAPSTKDGVAISKIVQLPMVFSLKDQPEIPVTIETSPTP